DYQFWSKYQTPALNIVDPAVTNCSGTSCAGGVKISPGQVPLPSFKNVLIPRIGEELRVGSKTFRIGYARRPSMIDGLPEGIGNYLDLGVNEFNAGVGFHFGHFLGYDAPCTLDMHLSYDRLDSSHVTKTAGDESGGSGPKIGSPGYDVGGELYGGGASLTIA